MPQLDSHDAILTHLEAAYRDKTHWIWAANTDRGVGLMAAIATALEELGAIQADLHWGGLKLVLVDRNVGFLTAPRKAVTVDWLNNFLCDVTDPETAISTKGRVAAISSDPEFLLAAFMLLLEGEAVAAAAPGVN
ncbi:MAG: hypothetical protein JWO38_6387 [Gemmataceae bacterium]|nr:hypothetical protein [Gemmataceae bacterium]